MTGPSHQGQPREAASSPGQGHEQSPEVLWRRSPEGPRDDEKIPPLSFRTALGSRWVPGLAGSGLPRLHPPVSPTAQEAPPCRRVNGLTRPPGFSRGRPPTPGHRTARSPRHGGGRLSTDYLHPRLESLNRRTKEAAAKPPSAPVRRAPLNDLALVRNRIQCFRLVRAQDQRTSPPSIRLLLTRSHSAGPPNNMEAVGRHLKPVWALLQLPVRRWNLGISL